MYDLQQPAKKTESKYEPKMIWFCDWTFETKVDIAFYSFYSLLSFIVKTNHLV